MKLAFDKVIIASPSFENRNDLIYSLDLWIKFDWEFEDNDFSEEILNGNSEYVPIYSLVDLHIDEATKCIKIKEKEPLKGKTSTHSYSVHYRNQGYLEISKSEFEMILFSNIGKFNLKHFQTTSYEII